MLVTILTWQLGLGGTVEDGRDVSSRGSVPGRDVMDVSSRGSVPGRDVNGLGNRTTATDNDTREEAAKAEDSDTSAYYGGTATTGVATHNNKEDYANSVIPPPFSHYLSFGHPQHLHLPPPSFPPPKTPLHLASRTFRLNTSITPLPTYAEPLAETIATATDETAPTTTTETTIQKTAAEDTTAATEAATATETESTPANFFIAETKASTTISTTVSNAGNSTKKTSVTATASTASTPQTITVTTASGSFILTPTPATTRKSMSSGTSISSTLAPASTQPASAPHTLVATAMPAPLSSLDPHNDLSITPLHPLNPDPHQSLTPVNPQYPDPHQSQTPVNPQHPETHQSQTPVYPQHPESYQPLTPVNPQHPEPYQPLTPVIPQHPEPYQPLTPVNPQHPEPHQPVTSVNPQQVGPHQSLTPVNPQHPEPHQPLTPVYPQHVGSHQSQTPLDPHPHLLPVPVDSRPPQSQIKLHPQSLTPLDPRPHCDQWNKNEEICTDPKIISAAVQQRMDLLLDTELGAGGTLANKALLAVVNRSDVAATPEPPMTRTAEDDVNLQYWSRSSAQYNIESDPNASPACPYSTEVVKGIQMNGKYFYVVNSKKHRIRQAVATEKCIKSATNGDKNQCAPQLGVGLLHTSCHQRYLRRLVYVMDAQGSEMLFTEQVLPSCCVCYVKSPTEFLYGKNAYKLTDESKALPATRSLQQPAEEKDKEPTLSRTKRDKLDFVEGSHGHGDHHHHHHHHDHDDHHHHHRHHHHDEHNSNGLTGEVNKATLGSVIGNFVRGGRAVMLSPVGDNDKKQLVCFTQNFGDDLSRNLMAAIHFNDIINDSSDWLVRNGRNTDAGHRQGSDAGAGMGITVLASTEDSSKNHQGSLKEWLDIDKNDITFLAKNLNKKVVIGLPSSSKTNSVPLPPITLIPPYEGDHPASFSSSNTVTTDRKKARKIDINGEFDTLKNINKFGNNGHSRVGNNGASVLSESSGNIGPGTVSLSGNTVASASPVTSNDNTVTSTSFDADQASRQSFDESSVRMQKHGFRPIVPVVNGRGALTWRSGTRQQEQNLNKHLQANAAFKAHNNTPFNQKHQHQNNFIQPQAQKQQQNIISTAGVTASSLPPRLVPPAPPAFLAPPAVDTLLQSPADAASLQQLLFPNKVVPVRVQKAVPIFERALITRRSDSVRIQSYEQ